MWGEIGAAAISTVGALLSGNGKDHYTSPEKALRLNYEATARDIRSRGRWLREGAWASGFSPLTYAQLASGVQVGAGGVQSGNVRTSAPLASVGAAMQTFGDMMYEREVSEKQQERTHESVMAQIEAIAKQQREAGGAGQVVSRSIGKLASAGAAAAAPAGYGAAIDADREESIEPVMNTPGANVIDNDWTAGPIYLPGSEPPEAADVVVSTPFIVPQLTHNWGAVWDYSGEKKRIEQWSARTKKEREFWQNYRGPVGPRMPASPIGRSNTFNSPVR